jgi:hypothetical protein
MRRLFHYLEPNLLIILEKRKTAQKIDVQVVIEIIQSLMKLISDILPTNLKAGIGE